MTATDPNAPINIPPLPVGTGTPSGPIGVGTDFVPPTQPGTGAPTPWGPHTPTGPRTMYGTTPSNLDDPSLHLVKGVYQDGAQWTPQNAPPADVYSLQQQLVQAGILSQTNMRPGVWDVDSANAYKTVLAFANATGMNATDALKVLISNPQVQAQTQRAPFQLTAPADITAQVSGGGPHQSNTARELLGKDLPASETNDFQKWYQDQEKSARAQYMAADLAGPGNSYTGAPNLQAGAEQYIKQHNLADTVAYGTASRMLTFFQMLKGVV